MYKKIKNSSFMNLIWFILCILPLMLLIIYSSSYLFEKRNGEIIENDIILYNDFSSSTSGYQQFYNSNLNESYDLYGENFNINQNNNSYSASIDFVGDTDIFVFDFNENYDNYYLYIQLKWINGSANVEITANNNSFNYLNGEVIKLRLNNVAGFGEPFASFISEYEINTYFTLKLFLTTEELNLNDLKNLDNWNFCLKKSTFNEFLNDINGTIQTNGFISNAFLNLSTLFGVNNIYYSLACYYIEYLLIIALLHLAFDLLYIVPNICHKFMEKIGGERD